MQILLNIIAVIFRIFSNSFSNVFQKKLANAGEYPANVNCINYILMSLFSVPLLYFVDFSKFTTEFFLFAIAGGIASPIPVLRAGCVIRIVPLQIVLESGHPIVIGMIVATVVGAF